MAEVMTSTSLPRSKNTVPITALSDARAGMKVIAFAEPKSHSVTAG